MVAAPLTDHRGFAEHERLIFDIGEGVTRVLPKLDAKFFGSIYKAKDNSLVSDEEYVVFLAKDTVFWDLVQQYPDRCAAAGCDAEQIQISRELVERIARWRGANEAKCHIPHAHGEETLNDT